MSENGQDILKEVKVKLPEMVSIFKPLYTNYLNVRNLDYLNKALNELKNTNNAITIDDWKDISCTPRYALDGFLETLNLISKEMNSIIKDFLPEYQLINYKEKLQDQGSIQSLNAISITYEEIENINNIFHIKLTPFLNYKNLKFKVNFKITIMKNKNTIKYKDSIEIDLQPSKVKKHEYFDKKISDIVSKYYSVVDLEWLALNRTFKNQAGSIYDISFYHKTADASLVKSYKPKYDKSGVSKFRLFALGLTDYPKPDTALSSKKIFSNEIEYITKQGEPHILYAYGIQDFKIIDYYIGDKSDEYKKEDIQKILGLSCVGLENVSRALDIDYTHEFRAEDDAIIVSKIIDICVENEYTLDSLHAKIEDYFDKKAVDIINNRAS